MKINLTIDMDDTLIDNHNGISGLIRLVACDIEQGSSGGFIRDNKTGDESSRWSLQVAKAK